MNTDSIKKPQRCFSSSGLGSLTLMLLMLAFTLPEESGANETARNPILTLSLEELMEVTVTSVSKKEERQFEAAAAVHVLTEEDIRRSGATTLPDVLRMVPGIQVAQFDATTWAITSRGSNSRFSNKLLVLIDGCSVYTPAFSGTNWDSHDTLLEDIERIEVIRGPGGTLWGANAVNGVINIITKHTKDTQGGMVTAGAGNEETGFGSLRYGGKIGDEAHYRVYGKYFDRDESESATGGPGEDDWENVFRGGFRVDWDYSDNNSLTFTGDYYDGEVLSRQLNQVQGLTPPFVDSPLDNTPIDGGHILTRWERKLQNDASMSLQFFYNRERRRNSVVEKVQEDKLDIEFQHRFHLTDNQEIVWGLGERVIIDEFDNNFSVSLNPSSSTRHIFSTFVQDEITLIPSRLKFIAGTKIEFNSFTGFEIQPNGRILWTPDERHSIWAAVSRAVRTPTRVEDSARINAAVLPGPTLVSLIGNRDFKSEELVALELGYRVQPVKNFSLDIATFLNHYDNLRTLDLGVPFLESTPLPPHGVQPIIAQNNGSAITYGVEVGAQWNPMKWWRFGGAFTWFGIDLDLDPAGNDPEFLPSASNDPEFMWNIQSRLNLPHLKKS